MTALDGQYHQAVAAARKAGSIARREFRALFAFQLLMSLWIVPDVVDDASNAHWLVALLVAVNLGALAMMLLVMAAGFVAERWSVRRRFAVREIYPAPTGGLTELRAEVDALATRLAPPGAPPQKPPLWIHRSPAGVPAVLSHGGATGLVLPLGFLTLFRTDRTHARAMLAHEIAHIVQQDAHLWALSRSVRSPFYGFLLVSSGIGLVAYVVSLAASLEILAPLSLPLKVMLLVPLLFRAVMFVGLWKARTGIRSARYRSEELADLGGAVCTGVLAYQTTLQRYAHTAAWGAHDAGSHPPTSRRIDALRRHGVQ